MWHYHRVISPKDADGMANSVNPDHTAPRVDLDQTAPLIWVYTVYPDLSVQTFGIITVVCEQTAENGSDKYSFLMGWQ